MMRLSVFLEREDYSIRYTVLYTLTVVDKRHKFLKQRDVCFYRSEKL
jgi:hypothetical protein